MTNLMDALNKQKEEITTRILTNADRIRAMTDAELANWLNNHNFNCPPVECPGEDCVGCWLDWLQQEEDDD